MPTTPKEIYLPEVTPNQSQFIRVGHPGLDASVYTFVIIPGYKNSNLPKFYKIHDIVVSLACTADVANRVLSTYLQHYFENYAAAYTRFYFDTGNVAASQTGKVMLSDVSDLSGLSSAGLTDVVGMARIGKPIIWGLDKLNIAVQNPQAGDQFGFTMLVEYLNNTQNISEQT